MRRADAVEAAEAGRDPHRAAGVGAERGIAQPGGDRRGRARGRAARHPARRTNVDRRAVKRVLADDAERNLVGDGLADQGCPGIEQPLHRPGMPRRDRVVFRPVGIAAPGRMAGDIEQILSRKGEPGKRPARPAVDVDARTGNESVDVIVWHEDLGTRRERSTGKRRPLFYPAPPPHGTGRIVGRN